MANLDGVFRREWGPAVAALARWSGDLTVAEDAVQEAFTEALRAWPRDGVPDNPGGMDRDGRPQPRAGPAASRIGPSGKGTRRRGRRHPGPHRHAGIPHPVRDDELRMMFTCAHPALDRPSQLALTLRLISGLTVAEIARALLQTEAAVGQRITRAKSKIRHANIPLRVPPAELLPERTPHVLGCIYSVFTEGYWSTAGPSAIRDELCDEGVRLAGELCALMPDSRDAHALAALVLLHDSRRRTRVDADGALVPLDEQDRSRWDRGGIASGLQRLQLAAGATGPYLPQAVIAALHATAPSWEQTDWAGDLRGLRPAAADRDSPVARANRALARRVPRRVPRGSCRTRRCVPTIRGWRDRAPCRRSAPTCCAGRADRRGAHLVRTASGADGFEPARAFLRRRITDVPPSRGTPTFTCDAKVRKSPGAPGHLRSPAGAWASSRAKVTLSSAGRRGSAGSRRRRGRRSATTRRSRRRDRLRSCPRAATPGWPAAGR